MLGSHSSDKIQHAGVILGDILPFFFLKVKVDSGLNARHAVEDGLGEIHPPLAVPRIYYIFVINFFGIDRIFLRALWNLYSDFLLVHGEDIEGLVELHPLASPDFSNLVLIDHKRLDDIL